MEGELSPGERVLWIEGPSPAWVALQGIGWMLLGLVPLSILLFAPAISGLDVFRGAFVIALHLLFQPVVEPAAGRGVCLVLVLIGLSIGFFLLKWTLTPLWLSWEARRRLYVITDQRVFYWYSGLWGDHSVYSVPANLLAERTFKERRDGTGHLLFPRAAIVTTQLVHSDNAESYYCDTVTPVGLFNLPQVKAVDALMRQTFG